MIFDYFRRLDVSGIISAGNSSNTGNTTGETANDVEFTVTFVSKSDEPEPVTNGNSIPSVTDVTRTNNKLVTDEHPSQTSCNPESEHVLPDPPTLPLQRRCYWCESPDMWLVNVPETIWRCRRCHPPVPGAEKTP